MKASTKITLENYRDSMTKAVSDFYDSKASLTERDHQLQIERAKPGDPIPTKAIRTDEGRAALASLYQTASQAIQEATDKARGSIDIMEAPTDEAVRVITLLQGSNTVTQREIDAAHKAHGGSYLIDKSLTEIADKHRLFAPQSESVTMIDTIESINNDTARALDRSYKGTSAFSDATSKTIAVNSINEYANAAESGKSGLMTGLGIIGE